MRAAYVAMFMLGACGFERGRPAANADDAAVIADSTPGDTQVTISDAAIMELVIPIATNNDDALQDPPPGAVLVAYQWMSLYSADHWGALRFVVPQIMRNATIVEAFLDVYVDTGTNEDDPNIAITSEASANPSALAATNNNISNRPRGTARVMWKATNIGSGVKRSPSIASVVQERVADPGWAPGQAIMFILDSLGPTFEIRQRDHTPAGMYAATLVVRYINP